jgi:hypothetical protein
VGDALSIFLLSLVAMFNPTLLAAVTILLLLPNPRRLMLGYLLGALLTSVTVGVLVVFTLHGSDSVNTARQTLSPAEDFLIGLLLIVAGLALRSGRVEQRRERRREAKAAKPKKESLPERLLGRGSARVTFFVGIVLSFPGASYLAALDRIAKLDLAAGASTLIVLGFCLMQQLLLEAPLIGYALAPERTARGVAGFRDWLDRNGRQAAANVALVLGGLLLLRGAIELIVR